MPARSKTKQKSTKRKPLDRSRRGNYVAEHTRSVLAQQIRHLRGDMSQEDFAKKIGVNRSRLSRLETNFGPVTLRTLLQIAAKLDLGLVARFVTFDNFVEIADTSHAAHSPDILLRARKR